VTVSVVSAVVSAEVSAHCCCAETLAGMARTAIPQTSAALVEVKVEVELLFIIATPSNWSREPVLARENGTGRPLLADRRVKPPSEM
jgi:hypothetical protein